MAPATVTPPERTEQAVVARGLSFRYGERLALDRVAFSAPRGAAYAVLGPNGSGKSTLFKLLATILPPQEGELRVLGVDAKQAPGALRPRLGVVFQSPAVDRKLTVRQNLSYGGRLFGLSGATLGARIDELLERTGLRDRAGDRVEALSGGLRRRVELAKCLLHRPDLLVLDEPTAGLDPAARRDLWSLLAGIEGLSVLFTTHLIEEAERAARVLILHAGAVVAEGPPTELSAAVGGTALEIGADPEALADVQEHLRREFGVETAVIDGAVRAQVADAHRLVPRVVETLGPRARRVAVSAPSLLDVYFARTGAAFSTGSEADAGTARHGRRRR